MAKLISLTQGKFAIVDNADYEWLNQFKWHARKKRRTWYARRRQGVKTFSMHREIMGQREYDRKQIDHKNCNGLDNRRFNLRICTFSQNQQNQKIRGGGTSRFKGVCWHKVKKGWTAQIMLNGKVIYLGIFDNEIAAARAYNEGAIKYFGEFALLNEIDESLPKVAVPLNYERSI